MVRNVRAGACAVCVVGVLMTLVVAGCGAFPLPGGEEKSLDAKVREMLDEHEVTAVTKPEADEAEVELGQMLFFDKILSGNENISCATCHAPAAFTGDGLSVSIGQGGTGLAQSRVPPSNEEGAPVFIPRNAPEVFNRAGFTTMFWDMRVVEAEDGSFITPAGGMLLEGLDSALAAQAMFPVTSRDEMRGLAGQNSLADRADQDFPGMWEELMDRLLAIEEYRAMFAAAFPEVVEDDLTFAHAANAMAAFEIEHWTLEDSPFDEYLRGDDTAISDAAKRGAVLFFGEAGCGQCHTGPMLTDERAHNRCVPQVGPGKGDGVDGTWDHGRFRETGDEADRFAFRTPPLRNVSATGPWMHDGAFATLEAAVRHELDPLTSMEQYDPEPLMGLMEVQHRAEQTQAIIDSVDPDTINRLSLSDEEVADIVTFLESMASPTLPNLGTIDIPDAVPSGLPLAD